MMNQKCLCAACLGLAIGITNGLAMLLFAWGGWLWGYGTTMITEFGPLYPGYAATFLGGVFGALWGLLTGFVFGIVMGWIYNFFLCYARCCKSSCSSQDMR